jgi:alkanesulfonate monooxygenase SsuD/methylene tetrahydromethanopterin reductase-like flavin-dependent oxidoreductase (luciferase family)
VEETLTETAFEYGLLLPHFGEFATRENLIDGARTAETYGFDSVWVRDHLVFHPHGMEGDDRTHIEPLLTLSAIGATTERIKLGTGSLIPYRHPIHTALCLSSLEALAGADRVIAGFGIGTFDHEFAAVGLGEAKRGDLLREQVDIMRKLWSGESVSHSGEYYTFDDIDIHPSPTTGSIPVWYCGSTKLSVRKAVEYCDGWMPGRITLKTYRSRVKRMRMLAEQAGRPCPTTAAIPIVSPAANYEKGLEYVNWKEIIGQAIKLGWDAPDSGDWADAGARDLEGAVIAGTADDIVAATRAYHDAGLQHLVFDLRLRYADWPECLRLLGEEVLPQLRPAGAPLRVVRGNDA